MSNIGPNTGIIEAGVGGLVMINGAFTNEASGTIRAAIGGRAASQFGRVNVTGAATVHGTLDVSLANTITPSPGSTFDIITYPSHVAVFDTITLPPTLRAGVDVTRVRLTGVSAPSPNSVQLAALAAPTAAVTSSSTPAAPKKVTTQGKPPTKSAAAPLIDWHARAPKEKPVAPVPRAALQHPAWVRDFILGLATPDPNHDIRIAPPLGAPGTGRR